MISTDKTTDTLENYLKGLLVLSNFSIVTIVPMGELAEYLSLSPGTVTTMVKRFELAGWLTYIPRKGCRLTTKGGELAVDTLKKHRLIEYFLVESLGMQKNEVHQEAEVIEHCFSENVIEALDRFLCFPKHDPHGRQIIRSLKEIKN